MQLLNKIQSWPSDTLLEKLNINQLKLWCTARFSTDREKALGQDGQGQDRRSCSRHEEQSKILFALRS